MSFSETVAVANLSDGQSTIEGLKTYVKKFAQAFAEYFLDRNKTSAMLDSIDLD